MVNKHRQVRALRMSALSQRVGYGKTSIYRLIQRGQFPKPFKLGTRAVAWDESEIDAWLEARIAERDEQAAQR